DVVHTMPAGLLKVINTLLSLLLTGFPLKVTLLPGFTREPISAITPSIFTLPSIIYLSASLLEHTPASLKYLFILIPLSALLIITLPFLSFSPGIRFEVIIYYFKHL